MNSLERLVDVLEHGGREVVIGGPIREQAVIPIPRMLDFAAARDARLRGGNLA